MKSSSKLACLFSLGLLSGLCMLASVSAINTNDGVSMDLSAFSSLNTAHKARLIKLYLLDDDGQDDNMAYISSTANTLDIFNGFVVNSDTISSHDNSNNNLVVIGGGKGNEIKGGTDRDPRRFAGIAGGQSNTISADNAAIGGGISNEVTSEFGVVAGGKGNISEGGVVLGGQGNTSKGGIVLGGKGNEAGMNGLAMGQNAMGAAGSFVRNDGTVSESASANSALIGASSGVLIGTYTPKANVSLVVNGAIKVGSNASSALAGEIKAKNGCFYSFDGTSWHVLGKISSTAAANNDGCNDETLAKTCEFGRVKLQEGDVVQAYPQLYANTCTAVAVTCTNGVLGGDPNKTYYPSCFQLHPSPYYIP